MAEYILEILKSQLMVMFSWGPHNFKRLPNDEGLSFSVDGFKYQGCVKVIYNEGADLFEIYLDDGRIEEDVYLDQLVDVIDNAVERTCDYDKRVSDQYNLGWWQNAYNVNAFRSYYHVQFASATYGKLPYI